MAVRTRNDLGIVQSMWTEIAWSYAPADDPWTAIDIYVNATDAVLVICEDPQYTIIDSADQEIVVREGFTSRALPPFWAIKFKVYEATALASVGTIDVTLRTS